MQLWLPTTTRLHQWLQTPVTCTLILAKYKALALLQGLIATKHGLVHTILQLPQQESQLPQPTHLLAFLVQMQIFHHITHLRM
jgi:hypothetical protein